MILDILRGDVRGVSVPEDQPTDARSIQIESLRAPSPARHRLHAEDQRRRAELPLSGQKPGGEVGTDPVYEDLRHEADSRERERDESRGAARIGDHLERRYVVHRSLAFACRFGFPEALFLFEGTYLSNPIIAAMDESTILVSAVGQLTEQSAGATQAALNVTLEDVSSSTVVSSQTLSIPVNGSAAATAGVRRFDDQSIQQQAMSQIKIALRKFVDEVALERINFRISPA